MAVTSICDVHKLWRDIMACFHSNMLSLIGLQGRANYVKLEYLLQILRTPFLFFSSETHNFASHAGMASCCNI